MITTPPPKRRAIRLALPLLILAPLLWLLVGCLYIPWFEHPAANNTGKDFRPLLANEQHPQRPIRVGSVTRKQAIDLLGIPRFASVDCTAIAYVYRTTNGVWVWPLCFAAEPGNERTYVARLMFDDAGLLQRIDITDVNHPQGGTLFYRAPGGLSELGILHLYNETGPRMGFVRPAPDGTMQIVLPQRPTTTRPGPWDLTPTSQPRPLVVPFEP